MLPFGPSQREGNYLGVHYDVILAGSVFMGLDSPLGPVYLAYGHAEGGNDSVYLFLGQPF